MCMLLCFFSVEQMFKRIFVIVMTSLKLQKGKEKKRKEKAI